MDRQKFFDALDYINSHRGVKNGIGTLSERTLHAVLKHYFEPNTDNQEIKIGGFVADIVGESGIIEVQTRAFDKLRRKLDDFLAAARVTVVYPVAAEKRLCWVDNDTGEIVSRRKSPKSGKPQDVFYELYKIKDRISHENFRLCIVMLDIEEYRLLNGWSRDKKRGSTRCERIPTDIHAEIYLSSPSDYHRLIPSDICEPFTAKDYAKAARISAQTAGLGLNIMNHIGAVRRVGKQKNAYLYEKVKTPSEE